MKYANIIAATALLVLPTTAGASSYYHDKKCKPKPPPVEEQPPVPTPEPPVTVPEPTPAPVPVPQPIPVPVEEPVPTPPPVVETPVEEVIPPPEKSKLKVTKSAKKKAYYNGDTVRYTIAVKVGKSSVKKLKVCDVLPKNMTYVSAPKAKMTNGNACWTVANAVANHTYRYTVIARFDKSAKGTSCNRVYVGAQNAVGDTARYCIKVKKRVSQRTSIPVTG